MRARGVQYTCNRCGKKEFTITGFTEDLPKGWSWESVTGFDLCPECNEEFKKQFQLFVRMNQYELDMTPYTKEVIENGSP